MKKTGIFYGSTTGTTESVAGMIAGKLGVSSADVHDVSKMTVTSVANLSDCSAVEIQNRIRIRSAMVWELSMKI